MIVAEYKLIPISVLCTLEGTVRRRLDELPFSFPRSLLEEPEVRYPFLYYALLTHWPELLNGGHVTAEMVYNRLYWFLRLSKQYQKNHDFDVSFDQSFQLLADLAERECGPDAVDDLRERVNTEAATNEMEISVAYSNFSIAKALTDLHLDLNDTEDYFAKVAPLAIGSLLQETLRQNTPLALAMGTEKARSELIIAPVLVEIRRQLKETISLFSGVELEVDPAQGLRGVCDFLLCLSPHQLVLRAPIVSIVEAKKDDLAGGLGQCLAEMVAARIYNEQHHSPMPVIYGVVTTGNTWKFMRLIESTAYVDMSEYHISQVERIVGILVSMCASQS